MTSADARARAADASQVAVDAARSVDAPAPPDARAVDAAVPRDAGAKRPKPPPVVDAAPRPPVDAAPAPATPDAGVAAGGCQRTMFETKLVADACARGGQGAAKAAMKKFTRAAKKLEAGLECKSCHEKLAPAYPLKDDALEHFQRLGGD